MKMGIRKNGNLYIIILAIFALTLVFNISQTEAVETNDNTTVIDKAVNSKKLQLLAASPEIKNLQEAITKPGALIKDVADPHDKAVEWLLSQGLEEGRNLVGDKLYYTSVGSAVINAKPSDPGYINSRFLAFQRALPSHFKG